MYLSFYQKKTNHSKYVKNTIFEQHCLIELFIIYLKIPFDIAINISNEEKEVKMKDFFVSIKVLLLLLFFFLFFISENEKFSFW